MDELANIESQIQALWEKAKQAGELIRQLREEKRELHEQNEALLHEIAKLRSDLNARDVRLASIANESKSSLLFLNGEREALTARVKELLARIEAYL